MPDSSPPVERACENSQHTLGVQLVANLAGCPARYRALIEPLNRALPFVNITALDVLFSDNVVLTDSMLSLLGVKVPSYSARRFSYNSTNFDATWTLPSAIGVDRLTLALNGFAAPPAEGVGIDVYANPFSTRFAVLPGDVDGDGVVSAADGVTARNAIGTIDSAWFDINGDGMVDINDFNEVRKRIGSRLP